jgi:hypothetical protein
MTKKKEPTKQEQMKIKREAKLNEVRVDVTFECGHCANVARRKFRATDDGLIEIPDIHCGRCTKHRNLRPMSHVITKIETKTREEWEKADAESRAEQTDVQKEAS